ncbi:NuA4 histone H4 acetyltransferase complex and the SWR1 complex subunit [Ceratobasidium sp. 395]|nr:NuA4 histone H4 acetyltransferase complex and the SWR1 complex subunit [Ceratobasidium sp. 395]
MTERVRGVSVHRPIIYGNFSVLLTPTERGSAPPDHTHRWTVAVRSAASPEGKTDQTGGADDISYFIKRVNFKLHETYPQPNRGELKVFQPSPSVETPPFEVTETGWGEFDIPIRITFVSESGEKAITLLHHLKLHPWLPSAAPTDPAAAAGALTAPAPPRDPIHAWQYEEVVFTDPPTAFMKILLEHPPTPLPKIKRRPANPPHIAHPASLAATARGAPEFSLALEKEEADRLETARKALVDQSERMREELIETEKELERVKAQVAELNS